MKLSLQILFSLLQLYAVCVLAWSKEDHEIFRLNDEVQASEGPNSTFYNFLNIKPSASHDEIIKAYRQLSKHLHPDKARSNYIANYSKQQKPGANSRKRPTDRELSAFNKQASARFARLGVVKDILRGASRERYDYFLQNGFPAWRGTGYYYARYRPGLGTVLTGLFVLIGGAAHYGAMLMSWKRRREFVRRYIRHARQKAWGNEMGIPGVDVDVGTESAVPSAGPVMQAQEEGGPGGPMNRKDRRRMEKEKGKEKGKGKTKAIETPSDAAEPQDEKTGPRGARKRVDAPNGKTLIVDANGDVYLEEVDDDGDKYRSLLDPEEIPKPSIYDTVLFRAPGWLLRRFTSPFTSKAQRGGHEASEAEDTNGDVLNSAAKAKNTGTAKANGSARKRQSRAR